MTRLQKRNEKRCGRVFVAAMFATAGLMAALIVGGAVAFRHATDQTTLNTQVTGPATVCAGCYRVRKGLRAPKPSA
jgi:hypothetical protein